MADINVERRVGAPWWIWVVGLIIVALLALWLVGAMRGEEEVAFEDPAVYSTETASEMPAAPEAMALAPAVQQYMDGCTTEAAAAMGLNHQYTSQCIEQLVGALDVALADRLTSAPAIEERMVEARAAADRLAESSAEATNHSQLTHDAFVAVAGVIEQAETEGIAGLQPHVDQLSSLANSVNGDELLLDQRDAVNGFFSSAGDALTVIGHASQPAGV